MKRKDFVQPIVDGIIRLYLPIFSQNKSFYQEKNQWSKLVEEAKTRNKKEYTSRRAHGNR